MPMAEPWLRFSELGTYAASPFQPRGAEPPARPAPRPRPTAGGYSSRSKPGRVLHDWSRRSRRASAPDRLSTSTLGQPVRIARSVWRLMFGYFVPENEIGWTPRGRVQSDGPPRSGAVGVGCGAATPGFRHGHGSDSQWMPSPSPSTVSAAR